MILPNDNLKNHLYKIKNLKLNFFISQKILIK
jgi:hypothetical protein